MIWTKEVIAEDIEYARKHGINIMLVEPSAENGIKYPYFLYIPQNGTNTMVLDCLNYAEKTLDGKSVNSSAMEEIRKLFSSVIATENISVPKTENEEDYESSEFRLFQRYGRAMNAMQSSIGRFPHAPAIIPIIPEYEDTERIMLPQELNEGIMPTLAPQIMDMVNDARARVARVTGKELNEKVFLFGHSQSAIFADHLSMAYPHMVQGLEVSGGTIFSIPAEEIRLQVVPAEKRSQTETFEVRNGIAVKKITEVELAEILADYAKERKEYQREITQNPDGTYSLPLNFPLGFADIDHIIDLSNFPGGKKAFIEAASKIPKMKSVGEREEEVEGHFAYLDGKTLSGIEYKAGDDLDKVEPGKKASDLIEAEKMSMHNRVMTYIPTTRILFGRSEAEKSKSYADLMQKLGLNVQSKIYKCVGHVDIGHSNGYRMDSLAFYKGAVSGNVPMLSVIDQAKDVRPIDQLKRRFLVSKDRDTFEQKYKYLERIDESILIQAVEEYLQENCKGQNRYKTIDNMSQRDIYQCFVIKAKEISERKQAQKDGSTHVD